MKDWERTEANIEADLRELVGLPPKGEWQRIERAGPDPAPLVWHSYDSDEIVERSHIEALGEAIRDSWHSHDPADECWVDYVQTIKELAKLGYSLRATTDPLRLAAEAVVDAWDNGRQYGKGPARLKLPTKDEENALREALR